MTINIQGKSRCRVAKIALDCFYVITVLDCDNSILVAQIVETQFWASHFFHDPLKTVINRSIGKKQPVPPAALVTSECLKEMRKMRGLEVAVVRPPFLIDFPRRAHTRDEFGHEKGQPVFLPTGIYADVRLCVSPQILYDNDCFGRSVMPAVSVRQSFFLRS